MNTYTRVILRVIVAKTGHTIGLVTVTAPAVPESFTDVENRHQIGFETSEFRVDRTDDGLTLSGYAAVFNQPTRITNWEGDFTEVIAPGAFANAVRANPRPKLQYDHGKTGLPYAIGAIRSMREDAKGLYIEAELHDDWTTAPIKSGVKSGAIDGMSFRFAPREGGDQWDYSTLPATRTLTDVNVFELGPVLYPAYDGTQVSIRAAQTVDVIEGEPEVQADLITALVVANRWKPPTADTPTDETRADEPPAPEVEEVRTDEENPADQPPSLSAPNPATRYATLFAVEAALVAQRSNYEPAGIPND